MPAEGLVFYAYTAGIGSICCVQGKGTVVYTDTVGICGIGEGSMQDLEAGGRIEALPVAVRKQASGGGAVTVLGRQVKFMYPGCGCDRHISGNSAVYSEGLCGIPQAVQRVNRVVESGCSNGTLQECSAGGIYYYYLYLVATSGNGAGSHFNISIGGEAQSFCIVCLEDQRLLVFCADEVLSGIETGITSGVPVAIIGYAVYRHSLPQAILPDEEAGRICYINDHPVGCSVQRSSREVGAW